MSTTSNPRFKKSLELYAHAKYLFPYGTQLFSRRPELGAFGQSPIYFDRAKNAHFWDVDGNEFIDLAGAIGPNILGYCHDPVDQAVKQQIDRGILTSINCPLEIELAQKIKQMVPTAEMVRYCKSGGETDAVAIRIARGFTGKQTVLFCGYHGWHDWYLAANLKSQNNLNAHLMPGISTKGVPAALAGTCIPFPYNDLDALKATLEKNKDTVACIIMEASRFASPDPGYLQGVRQLADDHRCLLIFDEVVTGFRLAPGGAQQYYNVTADMTTYAKAIANGYPLAVVAGRRDIFASQADNFISSTYWSDAIALAAGIATLDVIQSQPVIETLHTQGQKLIDAITTIAKKHNLNIDTLGHPSHFLIRFHYDNLTNKITTLFQQEMAAQNIFACPAVYSCYTLTDDDLNQSAAALDKTFAILKSAIQNNTLDTLLKCPPRNPSFKRLV